MRHAVGAHHIGLFFGHRPAPCGAVRAASRAAAFAVMLGVAFGVFAPARAAPARAAGRATRSAGGALETEVKSDYSLIRIRRAGNVLSMNFVRDNGDEVQETLVNLKKPQELLSPYTRYMFASYLLRPKQQRALIVGLGGGAMVHFLTFHDPELAVDAVEIDPAVVKLAEAYFKVKSEGKINVVTADAFAYLDKTEHRYDVIYMDAFLKPAADTDGAGTPLRMKTEKFYKAIQGKLQAGGLVAFNINRTKTTEADVAAIRAAFPQSYVFRTGEANLVALGSMGERRAKLSDLKTAAHEADQRFKASFSFQELLKNLSK